MKYYMLIMVLMLNINTVLSQNNSVDNYQKAIDAGKQELENGNFEEAINYFFAAEAYKPENRKDVKLLVDQVFDKIIELKEDAINAEEVAKKALAEAEKQTKIAKDKTKEAKDKRREAKTANEKTLIALEDAKKAKNDAIAARDSAILAKELENEAKIIAVKATGVAERLRIEALSTSTALKSISMEYDYQDRIKVLLAIEAFNMQKTMLKDSTKKTKTWLAPEIYTALHDAIIKVRGENYDEFPTVDTAHIGPVRAIFQASENRIYSSGSDGKTILWDIKEWKQNGKPILNKVETIRKGEKIITAAAIKINEKDNKELIAIGGQFSKVELIKPKERIHKGFNFKKTNKNQNYNYQKLNHDDIEGVYDMVFKDNSLYTLGKDLVIKAYDTEKSKAKTLIRLKQKAEHIAIHPDSNIIAVGYKNGNIDLFEIKESDDPLYELRFDHKELKGKHITALFFNDVDKELAFGTSDGYIGLVPMIDNMYNGDNVKFRKTHSFITSAIDFNTFVNDKGKEFRVMAVGNYDGKVSVWLLREFNNKLYEPFIFDDKGTFVTSLAFVNTINPAHNQLIVGYFDGTIKFWNMDIDSLAKSLQCDLEKKYDRRQLLPKERDHYYLDLKGFKIKEPVSCK